MGFHALGRQIFTSSPADGGRKNLTPGESDPLSGVARKRCANRFTIAPVDPAPRKIKWRE